MKESDAGTGQGQWASQLISKRIAELADWRGATLGRMRELIRQADPEVTEEWKWRTPVWSHGGIICTGESYKKVVKLTFAKGASLQDPAGLFNSSLEGNVRRAIDIHEGEEVDGSAFQTLVRQAIALNSSGKAITLTKAKASTEAKPAPKVKPSTKVKSSPKVKSSTKAKSSNKTKPSTKAKPLKKAKSSKKSRRTSA